MLPVCSGELSILPEKQAVGFQIDNFDPTGPALFCVNPTRTDLLFLNWTGLSCRLINQSDAYRLLAAEGGMWRISINDDCFLQIDVVSLNLEWLLRIIQCKKGKHWGFLAGFGPYNDVQLSWFDTVKFNIPDELKENFLPEGYQ